MKRGKRVALILVACGVVALVVAAFWPGEKEPEYQGKKLSEWLDGHPSVDVSEGSAETKAIRAIGTNAVPYLLKRIFPQIPAWRDTAFNVSRRVCPPLSPMFYAGYQKRGQDAKNGFYMLGPGGGPAISDLVRIARGTNRAFAQTAVDILGMIGDEAVPAVFDVLTNRLAYPLVRPWVVGGAMRESVTNKGPVLKALTTCLKSGDVQVRRNATIMLGILRADPDLTVPTLIGLLNDGDQEVRYDAIHALGRFRKGARPAAGPLLNILDVTKDRVMRDAITETLEQIAPDVLTNEVAKGSPSP